MAYAVMACRVSVLVEQDIFSFGILLAHLITRQPPGIGGFLERTPRKKFAVDIDELRHGAAVSLAGVGQRCRLCLSLSKPEAWLFFETLFAGLGSWPLPRVGMVAG